MEFFKDNEELISWLGDISIILKYIEDDELNRFQKIFNSEEILPIPIDTYNDQRYINILQKKYKELLDKFKKDLHPINTEEKDYINKLKKRIPEELKLIKEQAEDYSIRQFRDEFIRNKNTLFKKNYIRMDDTCLHYRRLDCQEWRQLEKESMFYDEIISRNKCLVITVDEVEQCLLQHLVFNNSEDKKGHDLHKKFRIFYTNSSLLELSIPTFKMSLAELNKINEMKEINEILDAEKPQIGERQTTSRKCDYIDCNTYLNPLNPLSLCKTHQNMNIDDPDEYANPEIISDTYKAYLNIHFEILDKVKIFHPGVWKSIRSNIMNTIYYHKSGVMDVGSYRFYHFYNDILPFIRWYIREVIRAETDYSQLGIQLENEAIRVENTLNNLTLQNYYYWREDDRGIKNNCKVDKKALPFYLLDQDNICKSKLNKDKYLYRDIQTASLFLREKQEIYQCPKSIGFHIKTLI